MMAETVILAETTYTGFTFDVEFGYTLGVSPPPFALSLDETYRVLWDGEEFVCETQDVTDIFNTGREMLAIGNLSSIGAAGNGEPFAIGWDGYGVALYAMTDDSPSHTVSIYQVESTLSLILKNHAGEDVTFDGVTAVQLPTSDGGYQDFVAGEVVEKTVDANFSAGDMTVAAGEGEFLSKVMVTKPETLIPENIAEGVDIAGIIGTLAAGGSSAKIAYGTFDSNATKTFEVTHNLGVVPDLIVICGTAIYTKTFACAVAASSKLRSLINIKNSMYYKDSSGYLSEMIYNSSLEHAKSGYIRQATELTFTVECSNTIILRSGAVWLAIGGLT